MKNVNCSKPGHQYNLILTTKCNFNYHYFMGLFEFVHSEWICWRLHNTNPGYQA